MLFFGRRLMVREVKGFVANQPKKGLKAEVPRGNGMTAFAIHAENPKGKTALAKAGKGLMAATALAASGGLKQTDPETAARHHLEAAFASSAVKNFSKPATESAASEFITINVEAVPLTGTTVVKFRQAFNKIPVYGSLVTVELDENHELLGISSSLGTPEGVDHIAKIAPAEAVAVAAEAAGVPAKSLTNTPRLHYYFDQQRSKWQLAYIIEDVPQANRTVLKDGRADVMLKDYVVDAQTAKLLAALPRTTTVAAEEVAVDGLKGSRKIGVNPVKGKPKARELRDTALNVTTYNFGFRDPSAESQRLPGSVFSLPPEPWAAEAVSAHANAEEVARFLRNVVKRNNIDGSGGEMVSSVNCWDRSQGTKPEKQWKNAYWNGRQMVYGQIQYADGSLFSLANMLEVVGHEMFHGVTDHTSRLEYQTQSGALNESFSDVFGTIIRNYGKPLGEWRWTIGDGFNGPNTALRDLADPTRLGQPKLMKNFVSVAVPRLSNDYGWVHSNSGIPNYAAYRVMTAKAGDKFLFTADELAALFYLALTVYLSRTSQFADARRAVVQAARTLFRNDAAATRDAKVKAVEDGYAAAGIK
jgi:Zn-dependent metalloprotease